MHWHKPELIQEGPWSGTSSLELRFESRKPPSTGGPSARTKITPAVCAEAPRTQPAAKRASRALFLLHVVCVLYDRDPECNARFGLWPRGGDPAEKKMKKNNQCTYVLYLARIELLYTYDDVIFLSRF